MESEQTSSSLLNFSKPVIVLEKSYGDLILREFSTIEQINLAGSVLVTSFPSTSLSSILSGGFLREQLKLPLLASISSVNFPSRAIIEDGIPVSPVRIFGNSSVCVIICEFNIGAPESSHLVQALFDFVERHQISMIVAIEGMGLDAASLNMQVRDPREFGSVLSFTTNNASFAKMMKDLGHQVITNNVINGINGRILAEGAYKSKFDVACLVAPTSPRFPDANSAVTVLRSISVFLKADKLDLTPLEKKAEALGFSVKKLLKSEEESLHASNTMYM